MKAFIFFIIVLIGLAAYYEYGKVKQINVAYQSVKMLNDSNGSININISILINNPSDLVVTITNLTAPITIGTIAAGTINLNDPLNIAAGVSTVLNLLLTIPTDVITFKNLLSIGTNTPINVDAVVSIEAYGIPVSNIEFPYSTTVGAVI